MSFVYSMYLISLVGYCVYLKEKVNLINAAHEG